MELGPLMIHAAEKLMKAREEANDHLGGDVIGDASRIEFEWKMQHTGEFVSLFSDTPVITVRSNHPFTPRTKVTEPATKALETTPEKLVEGKTVEAKTTKKKGK